MQDSVYAKKFNLLRWRMNNFVVKYDTVGNTLSARVIEDYFVNRLFTQLNEIIFSENTYEVFVRDDEVFVRDDDEHHAIQQGKMYILDHIMAKKNHFLSDSLIAQSKASYCEEQLSNLQRAATVSSTSSKV